MKVPPGFDLQGIAIPFFSVAEWERARAVIDTPDVLGASHGEFVAKVQRFEDKFRADGTPHVRVPIRVGELLAWARGRKIDAKVCAEFAAWFVKQQDNGRG